MKTEFVLRMDRPETVVGTIEQMLRHLGLEGASKISFEWDADLLVTIKPRKPRKRRTKKDR